MKLLDFLEFEQFNQMRKQMNTTVLGEFELFDPSKQLTWSEREALEQKGLVIQGADLRPLRDKTLAFKNSRVWLKHDQVFHLGYCPQIQQLRLKQASIKVGTYLWQTSKENEGCLDCLAHIQYQGIDHRRLRRPEFIEQIQEQFSLEEFNQEYPPYPIV